MSLTTGTVKSTDLIERNQVINIQDVLFLSNPKQTPVFTLMMAEAKKGKATSRKVSEVIKTYSDKELPTVKEGLLQDEAESSTLSQIENNLQIFNKKVSITGTAEGLSARAMSEVEDRIKEIKEDINKAIIQGAEKEEDVSSGRTFNGLMNQASKTITVGVGEELTDEHFTQATSMLTNEAGGDGNYYLFINPNDYTKVMEIYTKAKQSTTSVKSGDLNVGIDTTKILTPFGSLNMIFDKHVPKGTILAGHFENTTLYLFREIKAERLAKVSDSIEYSILTELSFLINPDSFVQITITDSI